MQRVLTLDTAPNVNQSTPEADLERELVAVRRHNEIHNVSIGTSALTQLEAEVTLSTTVDPQDGYSAAAGRRPTFPRLLA